MSTGDEEARTSAQKHATFLRSVLALDSSDPNLPRFVPPPDAQPVADPTPETPADVTTRTRRLMSRLHPGHPR